MKTFRKIYPVSLHGYFSLTSRFKKEFPELKHLDDEEFSRRFRNMKIDYYQEEKGKVSFWTRLTIIPGILVILIILISLPFNFIASGDWGYDIKKGFMLKVYNWLKSIGLS